MYFRSERTPVEKQEIRVPPPWMLLRADRMYFREHTPVGLRPLLRFHTSQTQQGGNYEASTLV